MRKIVLLLILSGINLYSFAQLPVSFPYKIDFETSDGGWSNGNSPAQFEYGLPGGAKINSAASGTHAWFSKPIPNAGDIQGQYYLTSPVYSLAGRSNASSWLSLSLSLNLAFEDNDEAAEIQYKLDGQNWVTLTSNGAGATNWYNGPYGSYYLGWTELVKSWHKVSHCVPLSPDNQTVQFRVLYFTGYSVSLTNGKEGIAIDDFSLTEIPRLKVSATDSLALVALYKSTNGPSWKNKNNWLVGNIDTWDGVGILNGYEIFAIHLSNNNLSGSIPSQFFDAHITMVELSNNNLSGSLSGIGKMQGTRHFSLAGNNFSGGLPKEFKQINSLMMLDLSDNNFSGTIPGEVASLPHVWILKLSHNNLSGHIPDFAGAGELGPLSLDHNKFTSIASSSRAFLHDIFNNRLDFEDLEPYIAQSSTFPPSPGNYAPQDSIGDAQTIIVDAGSTVTLTAAKGGHSINNRYRWYKNGVLITAFQSSPVLNIKNVGANSSAAYYCEVINPYVPGLTLWTRTITVSGRPANEKVIYRVNCGGPDQVKDTPIDWVPDTKINPAPYLSTTVSTLTEGGCWWPNRTNTTGAPYCTIGSFRVGWGEGLKYDFPVAAGKYKVNLFFAAKDHPSTVTGKVFDIALENKVALKNFDVFLEAGLNAIKKTFIVDVTDGNLDVDLLRTGAYPFINGIEIISISTAGAPAKVAQQDVAAYPNPLTGNALSLVMPGAAGRVNIIITDKQGVKLYTREINNSVPGSAFNLEGVNLNQGVYLLKIYAEGKEPKTLRLIKE